MGYFEESDQLIFQTNSEAKKTLLYAGSHLQRTVLCKKAKYIYSWVLIVTEIIVDLLEILDFKPLAPEF